MRFSALAVLAAILVLAPAAGSAFADPTPVVYTHDQAVQAGIIDASEYARVGNQPDCGPLPIPYPSVPDNAVIPDNAPSCYVSPESSDVRILAYPPGENPFANPLLDEGSPTKRFMGSSTEASEFLESRWFQGGRYLSEVSDPTMCRPVGGACPRSHFYSRLAAFTQAANFGELGWAETNDPYVEDSCSAQNTQRILVVKNHNNHCYRRFVLTPGMNVALQIRQCADPGVELVCFEIWNHLEQKWQGITAWAMIRCWNTLFPQGNCLFTFAHEVEVGNGMNWFDLKGGPDGLRMQNVRLRVAPETWPLFTQTQCPAGEDCWGPLFPVPYGLCRLFDYHHWVSVYNSSCP